GCVDKAVAKASEGGRYRFSLRQLFYAVRPRFIEAIGKEPDYGYFSTVISDFESSRGEDIAGMYRDDRGTLYHPHTGQAIPLGTLNVEGYHRPDWLYKDPVLREGGLLPHPPGHRLARAPRLRPADLQGQGPRAH